MKHLKALSKQLFGARYQQVARSFFICAILFFALYVAEIKMAIAPFILFLTATFFTAGVMWQALGSSQNAENMMGMFMLPFKNRPFGVAYVIAFSGYALITKTALVLVIFFAVCKWTVPQILTALLCACNGCFMTAAWYLMIEKKKAPLAVLWAVGIILTIFFVRGLPAFLCVVGISLCVAVLYLLSADAYTFYRPVSAKGVLKHHGTKGSIFVYLIRYLLTNKSYLINTAGLLGIACLLPFLLGQFEGLNAMPLGFAILCLNTPICILLSCDPGLEQAMRALPGQAIRFCSRYCVFIFLVNATVNGFYLCSWQQQYGSINGSEILIALLFAAQSAILSVLLEWLSPIRNWKIESDLWHHPRKYIVPLLMMPFAVFISTWMPAVWIWLFLFLAECVGLLLKARRI